MSLCLADARWIATDDVEPYNKVWQYAALG